MNQDPGVRAEVGSVLRGLFRDIGQSRTAEGDTRLSGLGEDLQEFMSMPLDLAVVFMDMSVQLTELVLKSLEEAGYVLVRGLTPA